VKLEATTEAPVREGAGYSRRPYLVNTAYSAIGPPTPDAKYNPSDLVPAARADSDESAEPELSAKGEFSWAWFNDYSGGLEPFARGCRPIPTHLVPVPTPRPFRLLLQLRARNAGGEPPSGLERVRFEIGPRTLKTTRGSASCQPDGDPTLTSIPATPTSNGRGGVHSGGISSGS